MTPSRLIDLRSDTVTKPTPAMRRAMAEAEVGDDVFGDDPTVIALERRVAALAGKEAALYVPSGTMGNQLAVHVQTRPADEVLLEAESHIYFYEQGGIAANSGCLAHPIRGERGVLPLDLLISALRDDDDHVARVTLVCAENTHNRAGGAVVPLTRLRELAALARERGLKLHLGGVRRHGDDVLFEGPGRAGRLHPHRARRHHPCRASCSQALGRRHAPGRH